MSLSEAERILGVKAGASAEKVRAAFSATVKRWHPDVLERNWEDRSGEVGPGMAAIKKARYLLLERAGVTSSARPCPVCRGTGIQVIGLRRVSCIRGCDPP